MDQRFDNRHDTPEFLVGRDRLGTGSRGFPADVQDVRAEIEVDVEVMVPDLIGFRVGDYLLAELGDAAHLHVLDLARVDSDARAKPLQHLRRELVRAQPRDQGETSRRSPLELAIGAQMVGLLPVAVEALGRVVRGSAVVPPAIVIVEPAADTKPTGSKSSK